MYQPFKYQLREYQQSHDQETLVNIFNIPNNNKSVREQSNNRHAGTHMNNTELIKFIEDIIVEPAAWLLDSLDYQHNKRTFDLCNKHNITVYRIPPNTTGWLQPCDIVLLGPAIQMVRIIFLTEFCVGARQHNNRLQCPAKRR